MNNRLDSYFRERLRDHTTQPSPASWDKVETRISKKNNKAFLLKIAAAIAAIGIASVIILDQTTNTVTPQVAEQQPVKQSPPKSETGTTQVLKAEDSAAPAKKSPAVAHKVNTNNQVSSEKKIVEQDATITPAPVVLEAVDEKQMIAVVQTEKPKAKKIVLVYSLPTINKPSNENVAVAEEEKRTGFQKVMDVAMDVRASESPLGELREAKDDLFALEFKKDKNKSKN